MQQFATLIFLFIGIAFLFNACETETQKNEKLLSDKIRTRNDSLLKLIDCDVSVIKNLEKLKSDSFISPFLKLEAKIIISDLNKAEKDAYVCRNTFSKAISLNDRQLALNGIDSLIIKINGYKTSLTKMITHESIIPFVSMTYCYYNYNLKTINDMRNIFLDSSTSIKESYIMVDKLLKTNSFIDRGKKSDIRDEWGTLEHLLDAMSMLEYIRKRESKN
jgi:hypothetical protein